MLCDTDKQAIEQWEPKITTNDLGGITALGHRQMHELGIRYGERLSRFIHELDLSDMYIQSVDESRTKDSAIEYINGMLGPLSNELKIHANNESDDYLLEYFHVCKNFIKVNEKYKI
jgi:hypothetical protein